MATAGVTYLLVARAARAVTARALASHPPTGSLILGVRPRLLLTWGLTSAVPMLGVALLFLDPSNPKGPGRGVVVFLVAVAVLVGGLATLLTARAVGQPLRDLRKAVTKIGKGDYDVSVLVDDAGEIGLLQEGVNSMAAGLAEREELRDLFGRPRCSSTSLGRRRWSAARAPRRWSACSTGSSPSSSRPSRARAAWSTSSRATPRCASSGRRPSTTIRRARH
jgi:HAMP domain-containing protein